MPLYVWLCQIGKRQYFSWLRRQRSRRRQYPAEGEDRTVDPEAEWLEREAAEERGRGLEEMEDAVPGGVFLRVFGELSFRQTHSCLEKRRAGPG